MRSVQKGSIADTAGLRAGDVIVKVGDQKISDNSDWREALRTGKNGKISIVIVRDKKEQTLSMSVPARRGSDSSALTPEGLEVTDVLTRTRSTPARLDDRALVISVGGRGRWPGRMASASGRPRS